MRMNAPVHGKQNRQLLMFRADELSTLENHMPWNEDFQGLF